MKPKKQKPSDTTLTYSERASILKKKSEAAEIKKIASVYRLFDADVKGMQKNSVAAVNHAREIGIHLQTMCGHEQMEMAFWVSHGLEKLPFKFESGKLFMSVARRMPEPAKTIQEAFQYAQLSLMANGVLEIPERAESQQRSNVSVVERFFAEFTLMRQPFQKIIRTRPMEQWETPALKKFLSETEWLQVERDRAENLLKNA